MANHTPGPWNTHICDDTLIVDGDGNDIALVLGDYATQSEVMEARSRLIAAAPDLLEALKAADAALNHLGDVLNGMDAVSEEDELHFPAFEKVRAAIAKAEGRS